MIDYYKYWFFFPHCEYAKIVTQSDGKIAYVCKHMYFGEK